MLGNFRIFLGLPLLVACNREAPPSPVEPQAAATSSSVVTSPTESLDQLDRRARVPLLPMMANHQKQNMRDHLLAVQQIVAALAGDDFSAIEQAASRLGFSPQMGQMCTHMGAGAPGFTEQALRFHHTADTIGAAARQRDRGAVLAALGGTLQTCTSCHAAWKQHVVDDQTWEKAASSSSPASQPHEPHP